MISFIEWNCAKCTVPFTAATIDSLAIVSIIESECL